MIDAAAIMICTWAGPAVQIVDLALCRAPTRRSAPASHVLEELQVAYRSSLVRRRP